MTDMTMGDLASLIPNPGDKIIIGNTEAEMIGTLDENEEWN